MKSSLTKLMCTVLLTSSFSVNSFANNGACELIKGQIDSKASTISQQLSDEETLKAKISLIREDIDAETVVIDGKRSTSITITVAGGVITAVGAAAVAYAKANDRSEAYGLLIPYFFGAIGVAVGGITMTTGTVKYFIDDNELERLNEKLDNVELLLNQSRERTLLDQSDLVKLEENFSSVCK